ncbi:MAG: hypothetical protein GC192_20495 [Bacteroidetes bacterium]|nr:hypothetical protein [Bacteroidota bacterium]
MPTASVNFRESCTTAKAQIDLDINNVRARLLTGGDMWWDRSSGGYVVPKPLPGQPEVSAIFAAGIWMGGYDNGGNLKTACQTYGNNGGRSDYWPGPLSAGEGETTMKVCNDWDRFFEVKGMEIHEHLQRYQMALDGGPAYSENEVPFSIITWPGKGNPYFYKNMLFDLPNSDQGSAPFFDQNGDDIYDPLDGDFPSLDHPGCNDNPANFPDQLIFWMYNDEGGEAVHGETKGIPIRMEVHATAFAYSTLDQLNDMTFQQHRFINRAKEDIDSFYFALWVDPELGCYLDDYIGCSPERNMSYWYNEDAEDGQPGTDCLGLATYGTDIPAVGIDIFRGPLDEFGNEVEMSSFMYYNNTFGPSGTSDPGTDVEFYRYMTGSWKDGTPLTYGGDGYDPTVATDIFPFAFPDAPNDTSGWSMCHPGPEFPTGLPQYDRRIVQSCGSIILKPGAVNELVFGVVYAPNIDYPCPDLNKLFIADDAAQSIFDNCIDPVSGPDAPDVEWVALDREIIGVLSNKPAPSSNNGNESYEELVFRHPAGVEDSTYNFEGYLVYQLAGPDVLWNEIDEVEKARLVFQTDVKNEVTTLINWEAIPNPTYNPAIGGSYFVYQPKMVIHQTNEGIRHSFSITEDQFAQGDRRLINHRKYYFMAFAYASNNYQTFDPLQGIGQQTMFMIGRRNIGYKGTGLPFSVVPRPIVDKNLNANFGNGPAITRIDGIGLGGNFVDVSDETLVKIMDRSFDGEITYKPGRAPIQVSVFDPLRVQDGIYEVSFYDENMANELLDKKVNWQLKSLETNEILFSDHTIDYLNEQLFGQYGFSISIGQTLDTGDCDNENLGAIGAELEYADPLVVPWFMGINYGFQYPTVSPFQQYFNFLPAFFDNECSTKPLVTLGDGYFVPYQYCQYKGRQNEIYASPAWRNPLNTVVNQEEKAAELNNVDIVFTPNKDLWSRCVVVETFNSDFANYAIREDNMPAKSVGGSVNFDLRNSPSVGKEDENGDGFPDPDGDGIGMGWFPGYAVDVETGKRLNVFFGENSVFSAENGYLDSYPNSQPNGADMLFNPNDRVVLNGPADNQMMHHYLGGQHYIYVTNAEYDACAYLRSRLDPSQAAVKKVTALKQVTWTCMPMLKQGQKLLSLKDGLIPNELHVKLRVDNPYAVSVGTGEFNGYPSYRFRLEGMQADLPKAPTNAEQLALINVVPNPYYAYSDYENGSNSKLVKITNLPAKCEVTIYSLGGKFIRKFQRNEQVLPDSATRQVYPDLEWDLENFSGKPISAGVYLIRVQAPGIGERTLKWFGINRAKDIGGG